MRVQALEGMFRGRLCPFRHSAPFISHTWPERAAQPRCRRGIPGSAADLRPHSPPPALPALVPGAGLMVSLPESSWAEPGESLHTTPYLMAGETEVLRAKTKSYRELRLGGASQMGGGQTWGMCGGPRPEPHLGTGQSRLGPPYPQPHSSTEKPQLFLWAHFNLTKSANY